MRIWYATIALGIGLILDFILGDPHGWWHPIRAIGAFIGRTEQKVRPEFPKTEQGERVAGAVFALTVILVSTVIPIALLALCYWIHPIAGLLLESVMCYFLLAAKSLKTESMAVARALERQGLAAGRTAVSMIVGRDTQRLDEPGVIRAAVETVAENTSDGVTAPLFYMGLFGAPGGFFYKAVNTMDSMVGYKNETYRHFGTAAAILDDLVNYIPARISGVLMVLASFLCGLDGKNAWRIFRRDRFCHASPNSAQTEAAMAGALGVQLGGEAWYFGEKHDKPTIGDAKREIARSDIRRSNRLMYAVTILTAVLVLAGKILFLWMWGQAGTTAGI